MCVCGVYGYFVCVVCMGIVCVCACVWCLWVFCMCGVYGYFVCAIALVDFSKHLPRFVFSFYCM